MTDITLPEAMIEEAKKAVALHRPMPYLWFLSPNAIQNLEKWRHEITTRNLAAVPFDAHYGTDSRIKKFFGIWVHEEETWAWGWCLFDAEQVAQMRLPGEPILDGDLGL